MLLIDPYRSDLRTGVESILQTLNSGGCYVVRTSGTTGTPKTYQIDLSDALARKRSGNPEERWLLTYSPERWAGISVVLHAVRAGCELCLPRSLGFADLFEALLQLRPTHLSLTPSMMRNLVRHDPDGSLAKCTLAQVTFGGEAATQSVLDLAARIWPAARISHVYASTEVGDICAVSDRLEGIPARKFAGFSFSGDGELVIDGHHTGDFWERVGERYYFRGRKEEIINVGGNKVAPLVIEEFAIRQGAQAARAKSAPSPLLGSVVALEYVGGPDEKQLASAFRATFPKYMCPALLIKVDEIQLSSAGKTNRIT